MCQPPAAFKLSLSPTRPFVCCLQNDYDLATLDLPGSFIPEQPPVGQEALAGLTGLQVRGAHNAWVCLQRMKWGLHDCCGLAGALCRNSRMLQATTVMVLLQRCCWCCSETACWQYAA